MCFRPAYAGKPVKCPSCEKMNPPQNKQCIQCKADLPSNKPATPQPKKEEKEDK